MKKIFLMLVCAQISFSSVDHDQLAGMTPYALFGLIERAKIAAFSTDSFKKSGADPKGVALWNTLVQLCNALALEQVKKSEYLKFSRYHAELDATRLYILDTVEALHAGRHPRTSAQAQKLLMNMYRIEDESFAEIRKHSKPSSDWISKIPKDPILTSNNKKILDDYILIAQQAERDGHLISEQELKGILKLHQMNGKEAVKVLIDNLEQYCYKKAALHAYARALITDLTALFPEILSSYELSLLSNTKDKPNLIIFAQSSAYENILHQILRELA